MKKEVPHSAEANKYSALVEKNKKLMYLLDEAVKSMEASDEALQ